MFQSYKIFRVIQPILPLKKRPYFQFIAFPSAKISNFVIFGTTQNSKNSQIQPKLKIKMPKISILLFLKNFKVDSANFTTKSNQLKVLCFHYN